MNATVYDYLETPIGRLLLVSHGDALVEIGFPSGAAAHAPDPAWSRGDNAVLAQTRQQLREYFAGTRTGFDLPLRPAGTPFQQQVWQALQQIPYGETCSYGDLARAIGRPTASRAVGAANGRNPLPIVIPCHRVIGTGGALVGFGGGLPTKAQLLALEQQGRAPELAL